MGLLHIWWNFVLQEGRLIERCKSSNRQYGKIKFPHTQLETSILSSHDKEIFKPSNFINILEIKFEFNM